MFKIIGIGVVALVLFWGFDSIRKWYEGDATPQEAVGEVRKVLGEKILGSESTATDGNNDRQSDKPQDTSEIVRRMMKD